MLTFECPVCEITNVGRQAQVGPVVLDFAVVRFWRQRDKNSPPCPIGGPYRVLAPTWRFAPISMSSRSDRPTADSRRSDHPVPGQARSLGRAADGLPLTHKRDPVTFQGFPMVLSSDGAENNPRAVSESQRPLGLLISASSHRTNTFPHRTRLMGRRAMFGTETKIISIVMCPGCHQPMKAIEQKLVAFSSGLVDVTYVCETCSMQTIRTISAATAGCSDPASDQ